VQFIRNFVAFWYDFIIGDDWVVAAGVVIALAVTALLVHAGLTVWWLMPIAVILLLAQSVLRIARVG